MRGSRHYLFFILFLFSFLFAASYAEEELEKAGGELEDSSNDVASLLRGIEGEEQQGQEQQPMDAVFSVLKKVLLSLAYTKKDAEALEANLTKALDLKKRSEEILDRMEEAMDASKGVHTPEKKAALKREIQKYLKELQDSVADSLILLLKSAGLKTSAAEKIIKENVQLPRFFLQLEMFILSRLEDTGFA